MKNQIGKGYIKRKNNEDKIRLKEEKFHLGKINKSWLDFEKNICYFSLQFDILARASI